MFYVIKVHDFGAILQAEMRLPLFQREILRPIAFDSGMATSYLAPERFFATWIVFFQGGSEDGG